MGKPAGMMLAKAGICPRAGVGKVLVAGPGRYGVMVGASGASGALATTGISRAAKGAVRPESLRESGIGVGGTISSKGLSARAETAISGAFVTFSVVASLEGKAASATASATVPV